MGSNTGFEAFVTDNVAGLLRFAFVLTGQAALAEDLVQTALLKTHRAWANDVLVEQPLAYVRRVLVNEYTSLRRRLRFSREILGSAPDSEDTDDIAVGAARRDLMWRALADLPRRQRAVLVLRYYEDEPDAAIATALGCAEGTVRSLAARAFATLRTHMGLAEEAGQLPTTRREIP